MDSVSNFLGRKSDSFTNIMSKKEEAYLPISMKPKPKFRFRALLSHCLYRRVVIWSLLAVALLTFTFFNPRLAQHSRNVLDLVQLGKGDLPETHLEVEKLSDSVVLQKQEGQGEDKAKQVSEDVKPGSDGESTKDDSTNSEEGTESDEIKAKSEENGKAMAETTKKPKKKPHPNGPHWLDYDQYVLSDTLEF